jgi:hypothetical protein
MTGELKVAIIASGPSVTGYIDSDLRRQIEKGEAILVVGAGVSITATRNPLASWSGLLKHGITRCRDLLTIDVAESETLEQHAESGDTNLMIGAADVIATKLGAPDGGEWRRCCVRAWGR